MKAITVRIGPRRFAVTPSGSVYRVKGAGQWVCATVDEVVAVKMVLQRQKASA